jgi:hypothetical protein
VAILTGALAGPPAATVIGTEQQPSTSWQRTGASRNFLALH